MNRRPIEPPVTSFLTSKAAALRIPVDGTFELTPVCNMNCRMCYIRLSKEEQEHISRLRSADEWISLGQEAVENGMLYLLLTGGEPFSHPEIRKIVEGLSQLGLIVSINTNGTLITDETVEWLKGCAPSKINITLYGASDETYDRLCRNPKGFTQASNAISSLKNAGFNVKLNCSLTPDNIDDLPEMLKFAEDMDLVIQTSTYMFPPLRKDQNSVGVNDRFTPEEAAHYKGISRLLQYGRKDFLSEIDNLSKLISATKIPENQKYEHDLKSTDRHMRCKAGLSSFWVTWKGDMFCCGMIPQSENNVFDKGFQTAWQTVQSIRDQILLPEKCINCVYREECQPCAAMCYTETGSFSAVPEYKCKMMHAQLGEYLKIEENAMGDINEIELERLDEE